MMMFALADSFDLATVDMFFKINKIRIGVWIIWGHGLYMGIYSLYSRGMGTEKNLHTDWVQLTLSVPEATHSEFCDRYLSTCPDSNSCT